MTNRRILFVSSTTGGGSGRSQRSLCRHLAARGVDVRLLADDGRPTKAMRRIADRLADASVRFPRLAPIRLLESWPGRRPSTTTIEDVEILASIAPHNAARRLIDGWRPDIVVGSSIERYTWRRIRERCEQTGIPTALYIREASALDHLAIEPAHTALIANAQSLADAADSVAAQNQPCVFIPSVIDTTPTLTESSRRVALLVNPVESHGVDMVWPLADKLPGITFVLQESWELSQQQLEHVQTRIATRPNVELRRRQPPGPALYGDARVLLVPHRIDNRPRVIAEANANGIPALVSDQGGLREAIGDGGMVLPDDEGAWADALHGQFTDEHTYQRLCAAAREQAGRAETDPAAVVDRFEATIASILDDRAETPGG